MRINEIKKQPEKLTEEKARIIAHLKGDGCICRTGKKKTNYFIYLELNDLNELKKFERDVISAYGLKSNWVLRRSGKKPSKNNWRVYFRSILAYNDLQKYGKYYSYNWDIPESIIRSNKKIQKQFIVTFFDDEGSVLVKHKEIRLYSINLEGLEQMQNMLNIFSIKSKISSGYGLKRNVYALVVRGSDIKKFSEELGFSSEKKKEKILELLKLKSRG